MADHRPPILPLRRPLLGAALLALLSCHYDRTTGPVPVPRVAAVVVTAPRAALAPGDTVQLTAQVLDSSGHVLPTEPVVWSSSTPAVASVDADGKVVADSVGATTITATAAGAHGSTDLTVQVTLLCDCTEIVDSTAATLVSRNDTTGIYVFRVIRGPPPTADSGTILVGAESGGYLRRVLHSALVGDLLTVETAPAQLEEAVRDGAFSATEATGSEGGAPAPGQTWFGPWTTTYLAPGMQIPEDCCSISLNGVGLTVETDTGAHTGKGKIQVQFTIKSGRIDFIPPLNIGAQFKHFQLQEFHALVGAGLGLTMDPYQIDVTAGLNIDRNTVLAQSKRLLIQQRPFATFIGPMPVVGVTTKKLTLAVQASVTASAQFQGTFSAGFGVQAGVKWTRADGWAPVSKATANFDATAPEFVGIEGTVTLKAAIVPEYSVQFYGAAGPFINLEPYVQGKAAVDATFKSGTPTGVDWLTDASVGLNLNLGAEISLLGRIDLAKATFAIPLVKPRQLVRAFSDGPLTVRTASSGDDIPAGYGVRLRPAFVDTLPLFRIRNLSTSTRDTTIAATDNTGVVLDDVRSGTGYRHQVTLTNVAGNCYPTSPNPDTVAINSGFFIALGNAATDTLFAVHCLPLGHLRIQVLTSGRDAARRYRATLVRRDTAGTGKGDTPLAVGIPGGATPPDTVIDSLIPVNPRRGGSGRLAVTLAPGRRNCATARPDTNLVIVQSGDTVETQFLVRCVPLGRIRLVTATADADAGPLSDTVRYTALLSPEDALDTVPVQPDLMLASDTTRADSLVPLFGASGAPGRYAVALSGAPNRCRASDGFTRSVTVLPGDSALSEFAVRCVERLQVVTRTTGPGIDPDGYAVVVENADGAGGADTVPLDANDTVGIAGVSPGAHLIALSGVDPTCVAPPPVDHSVSGSDSTLVSFAVTCPAPAPPLDVRATLIDTNRVQLAWTPPPGSAVARYRVYRDNALHDSSATPAFDDTGLPPFTSFVYQVSSVDPNGLEGVRSQPLAVRTRDATPPTAPAALVATAAGSSRITLAWQPASDAETGIARYVVYRDGAEVARPAATAYADTGLAGATTYVYQVAAINGDGVEGPRSDAASATTLDGTPPTAPAELSATAAGPSAVDLAWSAAADAESGIQGYRVYRDGVLVATATGTALRDVGLQPATTYRYEVSAVNGAGLEGARSASATATTEADENGELVVYTTTSGTGIPAQFTVKVNKDEFLATQPIAPTGSAVFNGLVPQEYHVRLIDLPSSCTVQDVNARKVTVVAGTTVQTTFVVTCQ